MERQMTALLLSVAAGAATLLGAGIAVLFKRPSDRAMALSLGLASGVMVTVSAVELVPDALEVLRIELPGAAGLAAAAAALVAGALLAALLELMMPSCKKGKNDYRRLGLFSMLALMIHNLPEGMAVFLSGSTDLKAGAALCAAIALHNIPEGISVAMPICAAGLGRKRALFMAGISGVAEPIGAVLAWLFFAKKLGASGLALIYCGVAGLMTALAFGELAPAARRTKKPVAAVTGVLIGVAAMLLAKYLG